VGATADRLARQLPHRDGMQHARTPNAAAVRAAAVDLTRRQSEQDRASAKLRTINARNAKHYGTSTP
jgi:hypothetical protein